MGVKTQKHKNTKTRLLWCCTRFVTISRSGLRRLLCFPSQSFATKLRRSKKKHNCFCVSLFSCFCEKKRGFTLIETLIYVAIIGMVVASFVVFVMSISDLRNKAYVISEVQANCRTTLDIISQKIRAATGINTVLSTFESDPGVLSLSMADSAKNPTVINLDQDDGILQITEGIAGPIAITSDEIRITNLVFTNLTSMSKRGNIKIEITAAFNNAGTDIEYNYLQSLQTAVNLRQ